MITIQVSFISFYSARAGSQWINWVELGDMFLPFCYSTFATTIRGSLVNLCKVTVSFKWLINPARSHVPFASLLVLVTQKQQKMCIELSVTISVSLYINLWLISSHNGSFLLIATPWDENPNNLRSSYIKLACLSSVFSIMWLMLVTSVLLFPTWNVLFFFSSFKFKAFRPYKWVQRKQNSVINNSFSSPTFISYQWV